MYWICHVGRKAATVAAQGRLKHLYKASKKTRRRRHGGRLHWGSMFGTSCLCCCDAITGDVRKTARKGKYYRC